MKKIYFLLIFCLSVQAGIFAQNKIRQPLLAKDIIEEALQEVSQDSVSWFIQSLQDMGTRFLIAENRREVASWIKNRFHSFGISDVVLDSFQCYTNINYQNLQYDTTTWQYNVVATIEGSTYPDEIAIVCGHHDDVVPAGDPEVFAPGADDNASGTAAVLESARAIMANGYQPLSTIRFITFAAEELMYFGDAGSEHYAAMAAASGDNIKMVINNDMIAYDNGSWEIGISNVIGSEEATGIATYITQNYTSLYIDLWPPSTETGADLQAFLDEGYQGVYLMESVFNPFYHTESDLLENADMAYCTEVVRISCGSLLYRDINVGVVENPAGTAFQIYPNPARDYTNILLPGNSFDQLQLMDLNGRLVLEKNISSNTELHLDVSGLKCGIYLISLLGDTKIYSAKLSIQR